MNFNWHALDPLCDIDSPYAQNFSIALDMCRASFADNFHLALRVDDLILHPVEEGGQKRWGSAIADQFLLWRKDVPPTLPTFLAIACDYFGVEEGHPLVRPALAASILGEIPHLNPYHNNHHFREVMVMVMRLCATHNQMCETDDMRLYSSDVLLLLIAAAVHDFGHDGQGNMDGATHYPSRQETASAEKAGLFLEAAGLLPADMQTIRAMIIATDVSRNKDDQSPASITRDIYRAHREGGEMPVTDDFYNPFIHDAKLSLMAMILCEADIAPSTGLSYDFASFTTVMVAEESDVLEPSANTLFGFMDRICHGRYLTDAAAYLMADNFADVYDRARQDGAGNRLYAQP